MLSVKKGVVLVLAATMALAAGCGAKNEPTKQEGSSSAAPAAPKAPVEITFWHGMASDSSQGKTLTQIINDFNASQKEVVVKETYQGSYTQLEQKLTSAIAASTPPTVIQNTDSMLSNLVKSKAVQPLDQLMGDDMNDYPASLLTATTYDGKHYGVPFNKSMLVLIYDSNIVKTPPKNWDEFKKIAKDVTTDKMYGTAFPADVYYFGQHFAQAGGEWLTKDNKPAFNSDAGVQALQLIVDMAKNGSAIQLKPNEYASNYFNEGRAAMIATTSASYAYITKPGWKAAPLYMGPKSDAVPLSGANVSIVNGIKPEEQAAAVKFVKYLTGKEGTLKWAMGKTGYMPVRKSAIADQRWADFAKANPEYAILGQQADKGVVQPSIPQWAAIQKEITSAVESAVLGKASPKDALDAAAKKADDLLAKK